MKSRIGNRLHGCMMASILLAIPLMGYAQAQTNPSQYLIIGQGQSKVDGEIKSQIHKEQKIALEQNSMAGMYTVMAQWERTYNAYLTTTAGYADALKAGTTLYAEGVKTLRNLYDLKKVITANPQGIGASIAMNNLYMEITTELIKTYRVLKVAVALGGRENMLTGAERTELLWQLNENIERLNTKLRQLAISVAYYNLGDVWRRATVGMTERGHGEIAHEALDRWRRTCKVYKILNE